ncbi:uncharacterized protein LOC124463915 [Hypomesus transpacificus]|uniref:uncharacterized protein LOC124463915 n=1 Tax=Hypomesus transpacificus TaxID=137520 RepID=UPI001F0887F6|nr:uncharacterized protein LOC124463915 [Hypomesus transpacificus]
MSVKGALIGHSEERAGLRRKLSGPHLIQGKSIWSWRPKSLRKSNWTKDKSTLSCQETHCSEEYLPVTATLSSSTGQTHLDADDLDQKYKQQGLKGWRYCFPRSVVCCRRKTSDDKSVHDKHRSNDFTFFNKLTRDSVDLTFQLNVINCILTREELERVPAVLRREKNKVRTRQIFKRFSCESPEDDSKATPLGPETFRQDPCVIISLGEKTGPFWRRRAKKPSPFFQERIEENREYIEEETIVLANRHADDAAGGDSSSPPQRGGRNARRHYPETLTVSVDVSAATSEVREVKGMRSKVETDADASETQLEEEIKEPEDGGEEHLMEAGETLVTFHPPETHSGSETTGDCGSPEEIGNVEMHPGLADGYIASAADAVGLTATGKEIQLLPDSDKHLDNFMCRSLDTPSRNLIPRGIGQGLDCNKSHPDNEQLFPCELSSSLKTVTGTCNYCVLLADDHTALYQCDPQPTEIVLRETACLVVQFVMKAALDQFKQELLESDVTQLSPNQLQSNLQDTF